MKNSYPNILSEKFQVNCADGITLKGILLLPENPKAVLQFNCGAATKKEFYLPFLTYLAQHGYICCLWDYRGSGESAPPSLNACNYTFSDYGTKDMPAIKDYLNNRFPDKPFLISGHSVGGQQLGFMNNLQGTLGVVNFAVSTGYLPHMPLGYRLSSYFFFFIFTPISILLTGYVKTKKFGIMEDLPKKVVTEWRAWCLKKDYLFDKKFLGKTVPIGNFKNYDFPIHAFWAEDDTISTKKNTLNYWKHVQSSQPIEFSRLKPNDFGVKTIGHFGFFKKKMKDQLWPWVLKKLDEFLQKN